jgi:hypothetical protein
MLYGILKDATNYGWDNQLAGVFAAPLQLKSNVPVFVSDTLSLKRFVAGQAAQRWEIEARIAPTNDSVDFMMNSILNGHFNKIYVRMPQPVTPAIQAIPGSTSMVLVNAVASNTSITSNGTHVVGEFIKFNTSAKVHMVKKILAAGVIEIFPGLLANTPSTSIIMRGGWVTMEAYYDTDTVSGMIYSDGMLQDPGSIKLVEAI